MEDEKQTSDSTTDQSHIRTREEVLQMNAEYARGANLLRLRQRLGGEAVEETTPEDVQRLAERLDGGE